MTVLARQPATIKQGKLARAGGPLVGQEYIRIRDQNSIIWNWWIDFSLTANWGITPEKTFDQEVLYYIIPFWIKLVDSEGVIWYTYPELDGSPIVQNFQPSIGDGRINSPSLRVRGGTTRYKYIIVGGFLDVATS